MTLDTALESPDSPLSESALFLSWLKITKLQSKYQKHPEFRVFWPILPGIPGLRRLGIKSCWSEHWMIWITTRHSDTMIFGPCWATTRSGAALFILTSTHSKWFSWWLKTQLQCKAELNRRGFSHIQTERNQLGTRSSDISGSPGLPWQSVPHRVLRYVAGRVGRVA